MTDIPGLKPSDVEALALLKSVAIETNLPIETVRLVVDTFLSTLKNAVVQGCKVRIRRFGTFEGKHIKHGFEGVTVRFKAAGEFKKALKQIIEVLKPMEKYGVELKEEAVLLAKVTNECPSCKAELTQKDPPKCPNCGTKPFEKEQ